MGDLDGTAGTYEIKTTKEEILEAEKQKRLIPKISLVDKKYNAGL